MFRQVAEGLARANMAIWGDPQRVAPFMTLFFQPKRKNSLEIHILQSVVGPSATPPEALHPYVSTTDGKPMNAQHDYVIKMTKDELPPSNPR